MSGQGVAIPIFTNRTNEQQIRTRCESRIHTRTIGSTKQTQRQDVAYIDAAQFVFLQSPSLKDQDTQ